ncbi:hypothetical protein [Paraclostridium tenue]|uniref:Uncharacterized protein n=1 Tax=Paraclostridium tenue TaxID=1737 RepID=A0ABN1M3B1_9FIRM
MKKLFNKKNLKLIIKHGGGFILGSVLSLVIMAIGTCEISNQNEEYKQKISSMEVASEMKSNEIDKLTAKLDQAKPWFDMNKEEQKKLEKEADEAETARLKNEAAEEKEKLEEKATTLSNGNYVSGKDFKEGIYNIVAINGNGNVSSSNLYDGGINAVMGTSGGMYQSEYKNIELPSGTKLSIDSVQIKLIPSN